MRQMKIARQIKIQRLQDKNRMVGQTFNPSGHTSQSLAERERKLVEEYKNMDAAERLSLYNNFKAWEEYKDQNNIYSSGSFEHNVFMRHFKFMYA